jgi:tetratricopeptide (TPR) repeat protein
LFRRLGVFANGCTLAAAEAVCAGDGLDEDAVLPGLETLVASSLVRLDDTGREVRFWLLETLREFALDELEAVGEAGATRARHAAAFAALAAEAAPFLFDGRRADWLPRLESELDNLRAAIGWALESGEISTGLELLGPMFIFWYQQGHTREAAELTTRLLDAATARDEPPSLALGMTYLALGAWRFYMGSVAEAFGPIERGLAIASALGDGAGQGASLRAMCLVYRGVALMYSGHPGDARPVLEEASALALQLGQGWVGAIGTFLLADVVRPSDPERARELYQRSLAVALETNDLWAASFPLISLGVERMDAGDYAGARELLARALEYRRTQADTWALAIAIMVHGDEARCTGDLARARSLTEEALVTFRDFGATVQFAWPLHNLGWIALAEGDVEGAAHYFAESRELAQQTSQPLRAALAESGLAAVAAARGDHDVAATMLGAAERSLGGTRLERDTADRLDFERLVERLRSELGTERFDALFSGG